MRHVPLFAVVGLLAACPRASPSGAPPNAAATAATPDLRCISPAGCTQTNGPGIYAAEGGHAGLGAEPSGLLITRLVNRGSSVAVEAGQLEGPASWRALRAAGTIDHADYRDHTGLEVLSISETATVPTWTLRDPTSRATLSVTGAQVRDLRLVVRLGTREYLLDFAGPRPDRAEGQRPAAAYAMRWRATAGDAPAAYCRDASGLPDAVVFQQGIAVDPVTGAVSRDAQAVTVSCALGAPATVYGWGYDHAASDLFHFAAAIQMKRASYCGDDQHYTRSGTRIQTSDDRSALEDPGAVEALWSPDGAICLNPEHLRHANLARSAGFTGRCNGRPLPRCTVPSPRTRYLASRPITGA